MVNRVFCYSDEEAKKNGNSVSFGKMLFQIIGISFIMIIAIVIISAISDEMTTNFTLFNISIFIFTGAALWYAMNFAFKFRARITAFATDDENNVYCATKLNNGEEFAIGGLAAGNIIDRVSEKGNSILGDTVQIAGAAISIYKMNNSAKIMQNQEIIAKMVEYATTTTGAEVKQILKVYSYTQNSHKIKMRCDYKIMKTGQVKRNKNVVIYKSFNCINDLINILLDKRGN